MPTVPSVPPGPACPNGHDSADEEFCDVCGLEMTAAPPGAPAAAPPAAAPPAAATKEPSAPPTAPPAVSPSTPTSTPAGTPTSTPAGTTAGMPAAAPARCPACDTPLDGRFCEACGHDSLAAPPSRAPAPASGTPDIPPATPAPAAAAKPRTWTATVSADREYFDAVLAIGGPDAGSITFPPYCPDRYFPLHANQITIGRRSTSRGINPDIDLTGPPEDPGVSHLHAVLLTLPDGTLSIVDLNSSNGTTVNDSDTPLPPSVPRPLSDGDQIHLGAWTTITVRRT